MHNPKRPDRERVRVELRKETLNAASNKAAKTGNTLSEYLQNLLEADLNPTTEADL
jgi:hypothetical protein